MRGSGSARLGPFLIWIMYWLFYGHANSRQRGQRATDRTGAAREAEVVLTRHGHAAVRLVPVKPVLDRTACKALLEATRTSGAAKAKKGPSAAPSQDFLYGDDGLPR